MAVRTVATLFRNASWSGASAAFRAASGLFNALLAVRLLGVDGYGHIATVLSLFVLYLSLNSSVFTALVVKLMAPTPAGEQQPALLAASSIFSVISILVLAIVSLVLREIVPRLMSIEPGSVMDTEIRYVILLLGVLTAIQIIVALNSALIESSGRLDLAMKWQLIGPAVVLLLLTFSFFTRLKLTAPEYVMALCAGALTDLCLLWVVKRKLLPTSPSYWPTRERLDGLLRLLKSGGLLQATSLMGMFLEPLNKLLLNHFVGSAAVTVYDLAMKVIWGIQYLFSAAMRVFLHLGSQDEEAVGRTFSRVIALVGVPVVILHTIGALFLSWVAHHWLNIDAGPLMIFFAIATLSNLGMIYVTPLYVSLIGRSDFHFIFRCQAILAATNASISLLLIPYFGLLGSAIGLLAATAYNAIAIYSRCKHNSGTLDGVGSTLRGAWIRYGLSILLFMAAIQVGISSGSVFISLLLVIGLAALMLREPMVSLILLKMGFNKPSITTSH